MKIGVMLIRVAGSNRGGWKRWSEDERHTFRRICGQAMESLGYRIPC